MLTVEAEYRLLLCATLLFGTAALADVVINEGTNIHFDVASDNRIAMDLLGSLWIIADKETDARLVAGNPQPVRRPRWSPDGESIVFESGAAGRAGLRLYRIAQQQYQKIGDARYVNREPFWHPGGERIVMSSARSSGGFDLWEVDLPSGLEWRLTSLPGDETEPTWSADGRHLVYIHRHNGQWSLMLRRHGLQDEILLTSTEPLAAPSWRPDGSLVTYMTKGDEGWSAWMTILSEPRLHRPLVSDDDIFLTPVAWQDREQLLYAANGHIRKRRFNAWTSTTVPFRAVVAQAPALSAARSETRELAVIDPPSGRTIIRAGRLFDGLGEGYVDNVDVVIDDGFIAAIDDQRERTDGIVVDLGDLTLIPGLIDAYAAMPQDIDPSIGPLLLAVGVTTIVAEHPRVAELNATWSGKTLPGPRFLAATGLSETDLALPWLVTLSGDLKSGTEQKAAVSGWQQKGVAVLADNWQVALGAGASMLLGAESGPASPAGQRYADVQLASGSAEITLVSGIADVGTPGIRDIWQGRAAKLLAPEYSSASRYSMTPNLAPSAPTLVAGSYPNGLPPGIALQAELRALVHAGLTPEQALKAAGVNAARALGMGLAVGRIAPGAAADLLMVDGDPLSRIGDALQIVGIVRNGRFYSVSGLVDRAVAATGVE